MIEFFQKYFINPMISGEGYNLFNTLGLAIAFIFLAYFTIMLFRKFRIKVDRHFLISILPFIFFGSVMRSLEDAKVLEGTLFVTPGIYLLVYVTFISLLSLSMVAEKRLGISYWKLLASCGLVLCMCTFPFLNVLHLEPLLFVCAFTVFFSLCMFAIRKLSRSRFLTEINSAVILSHLFDASTTFTAIELSSFWGASFVEQHVLAGFLMGAVGSFSIFIMKLVVVPLALWVFDNYVDDENARMLLKIIVIMLGLGPGLRNLLSMMMLPVA